MPTSEIGMPLSIPYFLQSPSGAKMLIRSCRALIAGGLVLMFAESASGGSVYLNTIAGYPNPQGGGPFQTHVVDPFAGHAAGSTFTTFCLEYTEEFYPGPSHVYEVNISDKAVFGHNSDGTSGYDPLNTKTAWLYSNWSSGMFGTLVGGWTGSASDLYALQDAIWKAQGWVLSDTPGATAGMKNQLLSLAPSTGGLYNVRVMQLWDPGYAGLEGHQHQDQLILVPTPTAAVGGVVLLAGLGIFPIVRRRTRSD
jgi:hypothetical protein